MPTITCNDITAVIPPASLPAFIGGACYVDEPITGYFANFAAGVLRYKTAIGAGYIDYTWLPVGGTIGDYEVRTTFTFAGAGTNHTGPASGVWTNLNGGVTNEWRINGSSLAATLEGTIEIRNIATGVIEATTSILETFISQDIECP